MGQWIVNGVFWAAFLILIAKSPKPERARFLICIVIATAGEILLCHFVGLYAYREGNIPLFVPPGHVVLYATGLFLTPKAPQWLWKVVLAMGLGYSAWSIYKGADQLSLLLFALWALMVCQKPMRSLVSVMFLLALAMELVGTAVGNWVWSPSTLIANGSMTLTNPPFAVGVIYGGLDFLVNSVTRPRRDRDSAADTHCATETVAQSVCPDLGR